MRVDKLKKAVLTEQDRIFIAVCFKELASETSPWGIKRMKNIHKKLFSRKYAAINDQELDSKIKEGGER